MEYFDYECRVRYAETDKLGISYYGNYFVWFEAARTEYFRALGISYVDWEKKGFFLPVVETGAKYFAPSTYDDLLTVRTSVNRIRNSSMHFEYQVFLKERGASAAPESSRPLIATGFSVHVFVDQKMQPTRVPAEIKNQVILHPLLSRD